MRFAEFAEFPLLAPCSEKAFTHLIGRTPQNPQSRLAGICENTWKALRVASCRHPDCRVLTLRGLCDSHREAIQ